MRNIKTEPTYSVTATKSTAPTVLADSRSSVYRPSSSRLDALIVFAVVAVVVVTINVWAGGWINREWENWAGGKVEAKLQKVRSKGVGQKVSEWIARGSDGWFMVAAALACAITTVGLARIAAGKPLGRRRIVLAALGYGLFFAGVGPGKMWHAA